MDEDKTTIEVNSGFWKSVASATWAVSLLAIVVSILTFLCCSSCLGLITMPFVLIAGWLTGL